MAASKRFLAALLAIAITASLLPICPREAEAETINESGEPGIGYSLFESPLSEVPDGFIGIYDVDGLLAIENDLDGKFILMDDIDLSSYSGTLSIGGSNIGADGFTGELEGNWHVIDGMKISIDEPDNRQALTGLFGAIRGASIRNLAFENANIKFVDHERTNDSIRYIGVLCGHAKDSTIFNCTVEGTVYAEDTGDGLWTRTGGICGSVSGNSLIEQCTNRASVTSPVGCGFDLTSGGICGELDGSEVSIRKCTNYGAVSGMDAAGICGYASTNGSSFSECANYGNITATAKGASSSGYAGGIAGFSCSSFEKCMNAGEIRGSNYVAGICAWGQTVRQCYNTGAVESSNTTNVEGTYQVAAGIIAGESSTDISHVVITDCFNTGEIRAINTNGDLEYDSASAGGIKGSGNMDSVEVARCYNRGNLHATSDNPAKTKVGHIWARGDNHGDAVPSSDNYSLESATLEAAIIDSTAQCTALDEESMKKASLFSGFDFENVWGMGPEDYPYPTLRGIPNGYASNDPNGIPDKPVVDPWIEPDPLTAVAASELAAFVTSGGTEGVLGQSSILRELTSCELSEWTEAASFYDRPIWKGSDAKRCDLIDQELDSARVLEYSFSPNYVVIESGSGCIIAFGNHHGMDLKTADEHLKNALQVYRTYADRYGADRMFITGSEYGGSLASYVCTLTGAKGCIFNASGAGYDAAVINSYLDLANYTGVDGIACTHYYTPTYYDDRLSSGILGLRDAMDNFWSYPSISVADNGLSDDASDICSMYSAVDGAFTFNNLLREESSRATGRFSMEPSALFSTLASAVQGKPDLSLFSKSIVLSLGTSKPDSFNSVWNDSENWFTQLVLLGDAGSGSDKAKTGNWNDTIVAGDGTSKLNGGWGGDLYVIKGEKCTVTIDDYAQTGLQSGVNIKKFFNLGKEFVDSDDIAWGALNGTYKIIKLLDEESLLQKDRLYLPHAEMSGLSVSETGEYYVIEYGESRINLNKNRLFGQDFEILDKNGDKTTLKKLMSGKADFRSVRSESLEASEGGTIASVAVKGVQTAYVRDLDGNMLHEMDAASPCETFEPYGYFLSNGEGSFEFEYDASAVEVSFSGGTVTDCRLASMDTAEDSDLRNAATVQATDLNGDELYADCSSGEPDLVLRDSAGNAIESIELDKTTIEQRPTEDIGEAVAEEIKDQCYTGSPIEPSVELALSGVALETGVDYDLRYDGNVNAGTASAIAEGKGKYSGSKTIGFEIAPTSLADAKVELSSYSFPHTGSAIEPNVNVSLGGVALTGGTDFEVSYSQNSAIGIATVTVTGAGNYTGTAQTTFTIEAGEPEPGPDPQPAPAVAERCGGADRYKTMALVSQRAFPQSGSCGTVVVARGDNFPDALAAAGLAGVKGGQVLLTDTDSLTPETKAEIKRLGAAKAYVLGDKNAVSDKTFGDIKRLVGGNAERVGGKDRIDTALKIHEAGGGGWGTTAIVATGSKAADALSASPLAYRLKAPIFLADSDGSLSGGTLDAIRKGGFDTVLVMGSGYSVSASAEKALKKHAATVRFSGETRYETSKLTAEWALRNGFTCRNAVATAGREGKYADALVASSLGGISASPLLLVDDGADGTLCVSKVIAPHKSQAEKVYVLGDKNSVSDAIHAAIRKAIRQ
ncbi:cell wall-binding repeat-containing protein [Raoultibacter massiliensis]|uniref:cell wall-binding repeat-containing protein n=1 Tax=Raoultibacter massiliensis TaxID=1852371 RepID=UPI0015E0E98D|nr:cell wall-binding repeat-containing protein [Raoultibacter massiliensis]